MKKSPWKNNKLFLYWCKEKKKQLSASQRDWFPCSQGGQLSYQRRWDVILIMTASVPPYWDDVFGCCLRHLKLLKQQNEPTDRLTFKRAWLTHEGRGKKTKNNFLTSFLSIVTSVNKCLGDIQSLEKFSCHCRAIVVFMGIMKGQWYS